jgi:hypothetical protein
MLLIVIQMVTHWEANDTVDGEKGFLAFVSTLGMTYRFLQSRENSLSLMKDSEKWKSRAHFTMLIGLMNFIQGLR